MVHQWLSWLFQTIPGVVLGFALDSMEQVKENAPPKWVRVGLFGLIFAVGCAYQIFFRDLKQNPYNIGNWLQYLLGAVVSAWLFYQGKALRHVVIHLILIFAVSSAELTSAGILWLWDINEVSWDYSQPHNAMICIVGGVTSMVSLFVVSALWRRFKLKQRLGRGSWAFVIMPLCTIPPFRLYYDQAVVGNHVPLLYVLAMAGAVVLNMALIGVQYHQAQKEQAERELTQLRRQMELERQYYQSVEQRREEMAKIRHDYNNLLSSVLGLVRMGKTREAEETVQELLTRVEDVGEEEERGPC